MKSWLKQFFIFLRLKGAFKPSKILQLLTITWSSCCQTLENQLLKRSKWQITSNTAEYLSSIEQHALKMMQAWWPTFLRWSPGGSTLQIPVFVNKTRSHRFKKYFFLNALTLPQKCVLREFITAFELWGCLNGGNRSFTIVKC